MSDQITERAEKVWEEIQALAPEAEVVPLSLAFTAYQQTLSEWFDYIARFDHIPPMQRRGEH